MSHTNSTPNYNLPQFITTDKPFWLTDINTAFSDIDTGLNTAKTTADTASTNATQALLDASAAAGTASSADAKATGIISSIADVFDPTNTYVVDSVVMYNSLLYKCDVAVTTPGPWTGSANWSRITVENILDIKQNKTDYNLTTSSTNIVGAINEVNAGLSNLIVSEEIYNQSQTIQANTGFAITIPSRAGYTAIGLGTTYANGAANINFMMDTTTRIQCYNYTSTNFIGTLRVNVIYLKN